MATQTSYVKPMNLDIFQALKRAFLRRGVMPQDFKQATRLKSTADNTPTPVELTTAQGSQDVHEKLIDITEKAQDVIFHADTVFPFTLFPDTITLDRQKLTVATRYFFKVARIISVPASSISSAEVNVGPFFGSIHLASKYFVQNRYSIKFLSRADAVNLERLLQGLIIAQEKKIELTDIDKSDLLILLKDLGQGVTD